MESPKGLKRQIQATALHIIVSWCYEAFQAIIYSVELIRVKLFPTKQNCIFFNRNCHSHPSNADLGACMVISLGKVAIIPLVWKERRPFSFVAETEGGL